VIAVDPSKAVLEQYLADYKPRYQAAVAEFDAWDDMAEDWGDEHDRMMEELQVKYDVYGGLIAGTRFEILQCRDRGAPIPARAA
jgi:hypothetical protein